MKISGWIILSGGGVGIIISAFIGSDWPMYAFIIIASAGAALIMHTNQRKKYLARIEKK
ncbi:MAG TPA: hypothetical protein G4O15_10945 [Dehalococcoidia bacterium]|nr:hypothetical protein [Dehalococcoidia bacterium]